VLGVTDGVCVVAGMTYLGASPEAQSEPWGARMEQMNETCDRCGPAVLAAYRLERHGELYLCRDCASHHWPALAAEGWTIWVASERALAPQAAQPSTPEPAPAKTTPRAQPGMTAPA